MILNFKIDNQHLTLLGNPFVVSDSYDYLEAAFDFSEDWDGLMKKAYFMLGANTYEVTLVDDAIAATDHINMGAGEWSIYVIGKLYDGATLVQTIPTNSVGLRVSQAGSASGDPFPPEYMVGYLKLNQSTPETIVGGVPLLAATRVINADNQIVDKKFAEAITPPHSQLTNLNGGVDHQHMTAAQIAALHGHSNKTALDAVAGTNTGDQVLPTRNSLGLDTDDTVTFANLSGTNTGDQNAAGVAITDAGGYYDATTVEGALQEAGLALFVNTDIAGTAQIPTFNADGTVLKIEHKNTADETVRLDEFAYTANTITETRKIDGVLAITLIYHTDTLQTEVI